MRPWPVRLSAEGLTVTRHCEIGDAMRACAWLRAALRRRHAYRARPGTAAGCRPLVRAGEG